MRKQGFKNDSKERNDMKQKGHHNNNAGGRRERELNQTQVAPTWRAVVQEIRFLFGFVTLERF